jgi:hypothetical protein
MPLVNPNKPSSIIVSSPTAQNPVPLPIMASEDPKFQGVAVDNRYTPRAALLTHLAGYAWTVDYFSQVIGTDSGLGGQRPTSGPVNQQYKKIEGLVMKVTQPLALTQDPATKQMNYTGRALMSGVVPNEGDMFKAEITGGAQASFRVLSSEKKSVYKEAAFEISYEVGTEDPVYLADLENKVVESLIWRSDLLIYGESPVILKEHDALLDDASNVVRALVRQYFTRFFSREYGTISLPEQTLPTYDPFLAKFITQMLTSDDCPEMIQMTVLNVRDDRVFEQNNLWKALAYQDEQYLSGGFTKAGVTEVWRFEVNPFFSGIKYSGMLLTVYPKDPTLGIIGVDSTNVKDLSEEYFLVPSTGGNTAMFEDQNTGALPSADASPIPGLYRVTFDDYYVLSANFYNQTSTQSTLEVMVRKHLKRESIDLEALIKTAKVFDQWGLVEQFYYVPILLALLRGGKFSQ